MCIPNFTFILACLNKIENQIISIHNLRVFHTGYVTQSPDAELADDMWRVHQST